MGRIDLADPRPGGHAGYLPGKLKHWLCHIFLQVVRKAHGLALKVRHLEQDEAVKAVFWQFYPSGRHGGNGWL